MQIKRAALAQEQRKRATGRAFLDASGSRCLSGTAVSSGASPAGEGSAGEAFFLRLPDWRSGD